jgi:hypothetical protein
MQDEAKQRGYHFDSSKISTPRIRSLINETEGQLLYEWCHLKRKLHTRDKKNLQWKSTKIPDCHPLFKIVSGSIEQWEQEK